MVLHLHFLQRFSLVLFVLASPPFGDIVATTAQELTNAFPSDQPSLGPSVAAVSSGSSNNNNDTNTGSVAPSPAPIYSPSPVWAAVNTTNSSSSSSSNSDSPSLSPLLQLSTNPSSSPTDATGINPDIYNGTDVEFGKYKFFVRRPGLCGGTLIHDDIVLTAAHCTDECLDYFPGAILYIGGTDNIGSDAIETKQVADCKDHELWDDFLLVNDLALIKLSSPSSVKPVKLNFDASVPRTNDTVTTFGLGSIDFSQTPASVLQEINSTVRSDEECKVLADALMGMDLDPDYRPAINLCARTETGAVCRGDSGGPVLTQDMVQVGIVSYGPVVGDSCGPPNGATIYAEVAGFEDWIKKNICEMSSYKPDYCPDVPTYSPTPDPTPYARPDPTPYPVNTGECEDYGKGGKGKGTMKCKKGMKRPKEPKTPKVMKDMKMGKMGKMGKKGYDDDDSFSCVACTFGVVGSGCYDGAPSECYDNNCC